MRPLTLLLLLVAAAPAAAQGPCEARRTGGVQGGRPLVIGDSSELLAVAPLVRLGFEADARGCRPLGDAVSLMAARRASGSLPRVVVLGVGANGGIDRSLLRRALRLVGRHGRLGLVTPATTPQAASAMRAFHRRRPLRTILVDWAASGLWRRFGGDGIHIGHAGEAVLARYVHRFVSPYVRPRTSIPFAAPGARGCGTVHPGGRLRQVMVLRGGARITCAIARRLARARDKTATRAFRWFDWRFHGSAPWKDVFVRRDGRVVVATRTPSAPAPAPGTPPPAPSS